MPVSTLDAQHPRVEVTGASFSEADAHVAYRLISQRRDIRHFRPDPVPDDLLASLLWSAHQAGSVGFMQPWGFIVVRDPARRGALRDSAERQRQASAAAMGEDPKRAGDFLRLKVEGIMDCGVVLVVTVDPTRGGHHVLGRYSDMESDVHSTCCAIENLWLAGRAEGLGMGWVSFFHPGEVQEALGIPAHVRPLAILCLGWPEAFPVRPLLEAVGWERRRRLRDLVHVETWCAGGLPELHDLAGVTVSVPPLHTRTMQLARYLQDQLTKPRGSLGVLEELSVRLAGMAGRLDPALGERVLFLPSSGPRAAGREGDPERRGDARAADLLAGHLGVRVARTALDGEWPDATERVTPAARAQALRLFELGRGRVREEHARGLEVAVAGHASTGATAAAALVCAITGLDPEDLGREGERGRAAVRQALDRHRGRVHDPMAMLAALGDPAIAALSGVVLEAAALRCPVLLGDGPSVAAAMMAATIAPEVRGYLVAACTSSDPGQAAGLRWLDLRPLLTLDVRLAGGSEALLALPLVDASVRLLNEMATFEEAGVSDDR